MLWIVPLLDRSGECILCILGVIAVLVSPSACLVAK